MNPNATTNPTPKPGRQPFDRDRAFKILLETANSQATRACRENYLNSCAAHGPELADVVLAVRGAIQEDPSPSFCPSCTLWEPKWDLKSAKEALTAYEAGQFVRKCTYCAKWIASNSACPIIASNQACTKHQC